MSRQYPRRVVARDPAVDLLPKSAKGHHRTLGGVPCGVRRTPASSEHWKHIRTTNPIESTFATVRFRTTKTKGCLSRMTALTMLYICVI